ncbi:hypothetical protein VTN02DRAFT_1001 [Thermoascus thermophilus]
MCHHMFFKVLSDRLFVSPINPDGMRILDIGTGTGIWPIQMGDLYPSAALIIGNDLSPIQPQWLPSNVKFLVDDVEQEWHEPEPYDFIHCRYMAGSIKDWPKLVRQCYQNLRPGGWAEFCETNTTLYSEDNTLQPGHKVVEFYNLLEQACQKNGRTTNPGPSLKGWIEDAGFENIEQQTFKMPLGPWPKDPRLKEIGAFLAIDYIEGIEAFTNVPFKEMLGWSEEEVIVFNAKFRAEVKRKDVHAMHDYIVVTAQKPV